MNQHQDSPAVSLVVLFRIYFPFWTPVLTVLYFVVNAIISSGHKDNKINSGLLQVYRYWRFQERGKV